MSTLFSKIIAGEIPSFKIYEDEYVYAFLDIFPVQAGHTLIVPKCEYDHFSQVPDPYYTALFQAAKKLSPALKKATWCQRICTLFIWYDVPHCHYHLIPTNTVRDIYAPPPKEPEKNEKLATMQQKIISFL